MSKKENTSNNRPQGVPKNNPGGKIIIKGSVPTLQNPPPPPPKKK